MDLSPGPGPSKNDHDLQEEVRWLKEQLKSAYQSIDKLIAKVAELEGSRLMKFRRYYFYYLNRLRSNMKRGKEHGRLTVLFRYVFGRGARVFRMIMAKVLKSLYLAVEPRKVMIVEVAEQFLATSNEYSQYLFKRKITAEKAEMLKQEVRRMKKRPLFSFVIPLYNPPLDFWKQAIESIENQVYDNWEICVADDASTIPEVREWMEAYKQREPRFRILYREENGHISKTTNDALSLVTGEYVVFMDQDDLIREDALYQVARLVNLSEPADLYYSDEDKINEWNLHSEPHFKPDWSPDSLLSRNYLGHLCVYRTEGIRAAGGLRTGYEGSQDYDLALRFTEQFTRIVHIPEVLYHWRIHGSSAAAGEYVKPYAYRAARNALTEAYARRGWKAEIDFLDGFRGYLARLEIKDKGLVSIIIPSRNKEDYLERCLKSIVDKSTYRDFEIILVDNGSDSPGFFRLVERWKNRDGIRFKYVKDEAEFNFSRVNNLGRAHAEGSYLVLLNNDTEVITPDWLEGLMERAQNPESGVIGCKLLYPDETIQHAGVIIGLGGAAGHVLVGEDRHGPGYFNYVNLLSNYSAVTAACVMVRTSVYDEVGGFDEKFKIEYNDVDFCLKVREAGYHNMYVPHVELFHYESVSRGHPHSTSESYKLHVKEVNLFQKRWKKYLDHDPCYNPNLSLGVHNFGLKPS